MHDAYDPTGLWFGPLFAAIGAAAFVAGIAAWRRPNSPIVRAMVGPFSPSSRFGSMRLDMLRALFPLVGSGFVLGGWYVTSLTVGCATPFPHGARVALSGGLAVLLVVAVLAGIRGVLREPR